MTTRVRIGIAVSAIVFLVSGCKDEVPAAPATLLDISVYEAAVNEIDADPWFGVGWVRVGVTRGETGEVVVDEFVPIGQSAGAALQNVPFGDGLHLMVEGWSQSTDGGLGQLLSRGRSRPFAVFDGTAPLALSVMVSRVNTFAPTSRKTDAGSIATGMTQGRVGHTLTVLESGQVLVTGGATLLGDGDYVKPSDVAAVHRSVEVYDPESGVWTHFAQGMVTGRAFHTATALSDGRIVLAGGIVDATGAAASTLEIFDPVVGGSFQLAGEVTMSEPRAGHTASHVEGSDHIVFAGGFDASSGAVVPSPSLEVLCVPGASCVGQGLGVVYQGVLAEPRYFHTATRVPVGAQGAESIVFVGGEGIDGPRDTLETFVLNPAQRLDARPVMLGGPRTRHTATYVPAQGFVHVAGGFADSGHLNGVQRIDSYHLQSQQFQGGQEFFALNPRGGHAAVLMPRNSVLLLGGFHQGQPVDSAEVVFEYFDPGSGQTFIDRGGVGSLRVPRGAPQAVLLPNQTVLVAGGSGFGGPVLGGEVFNPL